ncbi:hypothetical protein [Mycobacteroides abscessus]|uniref:hypothetical protein n=1 Tax=Mycobacteroides abscessus TaxID=36809 RepID=UPI000C2619D5|nr:hypothetical protein [Mycobacteroides abscessus]
MHAISGAAKDRHVVVVECPGNTEQVLITRAGGQVRPVSIAVDWANDRVDHMLRHVPIYTLTGPRVRKDGSEGRNVSGVLRLHDPVPQWIRESTDGLRPRWVIR